MTRFTLSMIALVIGFTTFELASAAEPVGKDALKKEPDASSQADAKSTSLFNGKDLTGWHVDVPDRDKNPDAKATFIVHDGKLVSLGQPLGHLITDAQYENYRLVVEYRFAAKPGNCGVLVHASTGWSTRLDGTQLRVDAVVFSPDGRLLASGSVDNTLRLWRVFDSSLLRTMQGHPFPILTVEISPNNQLIATGSDDGLVRIWNVGNSSLLHTLTGHGGWVNSLDLSPAGNSLASASDDYTVRIWRVSDGEAVQVIDEGMARVLSVTYPPSVTALAWSESDGHVRVHQISDGKWLAILQPSNQPGRSGSAPGDVFLSR